MFTLHAKLHWHILQMAKPSIIPAVEVDPPGCSYNPSIDSHQVFSWSISFVYDFKLCGVLMLFFSNLFLSVLKLGCVGLCCGGRNAESLQKWVGTWTGSINGSWRSFGWRRCEFLFCPIFCEWLSLKIFHAFFGISKRFTLVVDVIHEVSCHECFRFSVETCA